MNTNELSQAASALGRIGGRATGPQKAHPITPERQAKMQAAREAKRRDRMGVTALLEACQEALESIQEWRGEGFVVGTESLEAQLSQAIAWATPTEQKGQVKS